jgi:hypothetical protein
MMTSCDTETPVDRTPVYGDFANDLQSKNLYGNVKRITFKSARMTESNGTNEKATLETPRTREVMTFTKAKNVDKLEVFSAWGKLETLMQFTYNKKNLVTEIETQSFYDNDKKIFRQLKTYQNDTLLTKEEVFIEDKLDSQATYEYNFENNSILQTLKEANDTIQLTVQEILNAQGKIEKIVHTHKDKSKSVATFTYNDAGNVIASTSSVGIVDSQTDYTYQDNILIETKYKATQTQYLDHGNNSSATITKYDAYYNPIQATFYDASDAVSYIEKYEYEFDTVGNWIKKTTYSNTNSENKEDFKIISLDTRDISYY